ncbi:hypothetical protein EOI86_22465 [Hwanghaeella grinnelliae]|uniref:Thermostable hemolysin n=1 Tax=Hwanghaeella grinnelliae TaxID=2500179 RepID=A0A3S2VML5_9PROT|nr:thermostable hemolysin [Hwanghaeella grinnelliae]RVU33898.1 hypothetical protein EOI86_22465 [Hwanghaeella grinnelliae]
MPFAIIRPDDRRRTAVETMIRSVYRDRYQAMIADFPPCLAALFNADNVPLCAAGLRDDDSGFFSEVYLDQSVEASIARLAREPVARTSILEVTTLAASHPGHALKLVDHIVADGEQRGMKWGLFTATRPLRIGLRRSGAGVLEIALAEQHRVENAEQWGSYYETNPIVCAVSGDGYGDAAARPAPRRNTSLKQEQERARHA